MNLTARLARIAGLLPLVLACCGAVLLVSCATVQTPALVAAKPDRTEGLRALGFEKTDDGYVLNLPGALLFDTDSDVLSNAAKLALTKLAVDLKTLDISKLKLFGHTDNTGSAEYNRELSTKRADAVAREIAAHGFASENLERRGFAFDRPIATNATPEGRAQNRRVAVIVPFE